MAAKQLLISLLCAAALLLLPVQPLLAAPGQNDEVILGDDLTLQAGEHVDGELVLLGGNLVMRAGSSVAGSVTVLGGRVEVDGTIDGDLVALGGDVTLGAQARVRGETIALGGQLRQSAGAETGDIVQGPSIGKLQFWQILRSPFFSPGHTGGQVPIVGTILVSLAVAIGLALLAATVVALWPAQTAKVGETIVQAPLPSLGVGCLLFPLAASLTFFALITICLAPLAPAVVLLLVAASLFGWIALGALWGRRLVHWAGWRRATPLAATGIGVFALTILAAVAGLVPWLGVLLTLGAASVGLGAVVLSRFGTRRYRHPPASPTSA